MNRINEALAQFDSPPNELTWENDRAMGIALGVLADAARAYVADWETCPTCNGSGNSIEERTWKPEDGYPLPPIKSCPDCVGGMIPSPALIEKVHRWACCEATRPTSGSISNVGADWPDGSRPKLTGVTLLTWRGRKEEG